MADRDPLLNALRSKLETAEKAELPDLVKRVKARIAQLEKPAPKPAPAAVATKPPVKPRARKATKTSAVAKKAAVTRAAKKS